MRQHALALSLVLLVGLLSVAACDRAPSRDPAAAAPVPVAANAMTHGFGGREDCRSCHLTGSNRARKSPDDHRSYNNDACGLCHKPG